nr:hypothetical protein [Sorangium cellulosum]
MHPEERLHGRVDVDVHEPVLSASNKGEPVVDDHAVQRVERLLIEPAEVPVDGVDARDDAACEAHEERIDGERFDAEDALLAGERAVHQQAHLRSHRVDDRAAGLQPGEPAAKGRVDAELADEGAERSKPCDARQVLLRGLDVNPGRVWPPDSPLVPPVAFPLEPELASTHLGGARRVPSFGHSNPHGSPRRAFISSTSVYDAGFLTPRIGIVGAKSTMNARRGARRRS